MRRSATGARGIDGGAELSTRAAAAARATPHEPQKRAFGSLWVPQSGQVTANGLPQCRQNRLVAAFAVPQLAQTMVSPLSAPEPLAASVPESRLGAVVPRRGPAPRAAGASAERRRLQVRRLG